MAEEIKELIEKIQEEGIQQAEEKARQIEKEARLKSDAIIQKAQQQANNEERDAQEKIKRMEESARVSLKQAGRDLLLSLRKEINSLLDKIVKVQVASILSSEDLARIITLLIKERSLSADAEIILKLSEQDKNKLADSFINQLKDGVKKGIQLKASSEIQGGFIISFDGGKSSFDFTDKAISEYLSVFLKPKLSELLKD